VQKKDIIVNAKIQPKGRPNSLMKKMKIIMIFQQNIKRKKTSVKKSKLL
jgi:hypothetical protein